MVRNVQLHEKQLISAYLEAQPYGAGLIAPVGVTYCTNALSGANKKRSYTLGGTLRPVPNPHFLGESTRHLSYFGSQRPSQHRLGIITFADGIAISGGISKIDWKPVVKSAIFLANFLFLLLISSQRYLSSTK